jgi:hypothetical protein
MTVAELIDYLKQLEGTAEVVLMDDSLVLHPNPDSVVVLSYIEGLA